MSEQLFDLQGLVSALRRSRRLLVVLALLGAAAGVGFALVRPPLYSATSLVLIPTPAAASATASSSGSTSSDAMTDAAIAVSSAVLAPALAHVDPSLPLSVAKQRVGATSTAANVVEVTASGSNPPQAQRLANAVADSLVSFVTTSGSATASSAVAGLQAQSAQLTSQINDLDAEIHSTNAAVTSGKLSAAVLQQDTALLASLNSSQSNASLQLASVNSQIATAKLSVGIANAGTEVIQRATSASLPSPLRRGQPVVVGIAVGLLAGLVLAMSRRRGGRLSGRDQIAEAAGLPVLLSSTVGRWRASSDWLELFREHELGTTQRWNVRKALHHLGLIEDAPATLSVVSLAHDAPSMAATALLAIAAASLDTRTRLVLMSNDDLSEALGNACDLLSARGEEVRPNLEVAKEAAAPRTEPWLTILSVVVDPEQPRQGVRLARGAVVLAVTAGGVTADEIASVLIAMGEEGLSVRGIFVTNPGADDPTAGRPSSTAPRADQILRLRTLGATAEWRSVSD